MREPVCVSACVSSFVAAPDVVAAAAVVAGSVGPEAWPLAGIVQPLRRLPFG